jgi:steroid 5-alpha reductase family enzyme
MSAVLAANALLVAAMFTALWVASVRLRDASIVDPWWSIGFLAVALRTVSSSGPSPAKVLLVAMVAVWALRLSLHLHRRAKGKPEDPRYQAFRKHFGEARYWWVSFFQVFMLQGALLLVVSAPLQCALAVRGDDPLRWNDLLGAALWLLGFAFEAVGDAQLQAFRDDPTKRGTVLDTGLWRYTRHPNYFGDALLWWGFGLCALDAPWGTVALVGPVLMTVLLRRVSGVTMLEPMLTRTRPGYAEYVRRTPAFFPWWPRA